MIEEREGQEETRVDKENKDMLEINMFLNNYITFHKHITFSQTIMFYCKY